MMSPVGLSYPKAKRQLERRWTRWSTTMPQRRIYQSRRKGCRCKAMDSRAMGLAIPWYRRGRTSVESSIPCSHGGRALVVKGAKEVENAKRMGEVKYPSSLTYPAEELCIGSLTLQRKLMKDNSYQILTIGVQYY
ncbi:hypothetical protein B296_00002429 [Ensete ventricosum]|uniref:Uncharacterized protein n=1 Tax=Ensete ventricosum TaxID=4639 RepID=A0A426ZZB1_ENSVE|nr:hypothetical protein B296_00002429 [Ensete ventricosum]